MRINRHYINALRTQTAYTPTWLPTTKVAPGDICRLVNSEYQPLTTLAEYGVAFTARPGNALREFSYTSQDAVSIEYKASGDTPLDGWTLSQADAGVRFSFGRANAIIVHATECKSFRIVDLHDVESQILKLYKEKAWPNDYAVVVETIVAQETSIVISSSADSHIEIAVAETSFQKNLGSLSPGATVRSERNLALKIVAASQLTPLFRAVGIRRNITGKPALRSGDSEPSQLAAVRYEDFDED